VAAGEAHQLHVVTNMTEYVAPALACIDRTFNNLITPSRPQDPEDVDADPLFVMKVGMYTGMAVSPLLLLLIGLRCSRILSRLCGAF
jgi:hypothetical protein